MPAGLTENDWRQVLKLSEAVAGLSFAQRVRFLQSASVSPEIMRHVLERTTDRSSVGFSESEDLNAEPFVTPGLRIGHFNTIERLGAGGMGEVWSAHDSSLDRTVALKFFFPRTLTGVSEQLITPRSARGVSAEPSQHRHDSRDRSVGKRFRYGDGTRRRNGAPPVDR